MFAYSIMFSFLYVLNFFILLRLSQVFTKTLHRREQGQSGKYVKRLCTGCEGGHSGLQHAAVCNLFMGRDLEHACAARKFCVKGSILTAAI